VRFSCAPQFHAEAAVETEIPYETSSSAGSHHVWRIRTPTRAFCVHLLGATGGGPPRRSTYFEAVAVYERGLEALQRHDYQVAAGLLESVLRTYPEEKELHERVRLYLNICQRHVAPREASPQTVEERLYASTLAINGGRYDEAISHLRLVRDEDPDNDHALYTLAVAHAQRGEHAEAIAHLERAIALNPENRVLARRDPDLEPLREDEAFRMALESNSTSTRPVDRRRPPIRTKSAR
jgi:tetratricopeptide (TPR) repeat protein